MKPLSLASFGAGFLLVLAAAGCSRISFSNSATLTSIQTRSSIETDADVRVFTAMDRNTGDFYLTDLPLESIHADPLTLKGAMVHVHVFVRPKAGDTPIADEACNFTIRQIVFTGGEVGVYSGAGFLTISGELGDRTCGGRFRGATLRLTQATAGFNDRLGPSEMYGSFNATRDDRASTDLAKLLAKAMQASAKNPSKPAETDPAR